MATQSKSEDSVDVPNEHQQSIEDELDTATASKRLAEIERDPDLLVRGKALEEELADILSE